VYELEHWLLALCEKKSRKKALKKGPPISDPQFEKTSWFHFMKLGIDEKIKEQIN